MTERALFDVEEHEALLPLPWSEDFVRAKIKQIALAVDQAFDPEHFWPSHPHDEDWDPKAPMTSIFWGAPGIAWALIQLKEMGLIESLGHDYLKYSESFHATYLKTPDTDGISPGYLFGETGILFAHYRVNPSQALDDALLEKTRVLDQARENEILWGQPAGLLLSLQMFELTQNERWRQRVSEIAALQFSIWKIDEGTGIPVFTQDLYGKISQYLGAAHGSAGNINGLLRALPLLPEHLRKSFLDFAEQFLLKTAILKNEWANWLPLLHFKSPDLITQWCHGAPGMVTSYKFFPKGLNQEVEQVLLKAGELTWAAGPLQKPFGICHGTAGNGYAFLTLHERTGDKLWLDRAQAFAMHAIHQSDESEKKYGRRRFGLYSGDVGLIVYLSQVLEAKSAWPFIDGK